MKSPCSLKRKCFGNMDKSEKNRILFIITRLLQVKVIPLKKVQRKKKSKMKYRWKKDIMSQKTGVFMSMEVHQCVSTCYTWPLEKWELLWRKEIIKVGFICKMVEQNTITTNSSWRFKVIYMETHQQVSSIWKPLLQVLYRNEIFESWSMYYGDIWTS